MAERKAELMRLAGLGPQLVGCVVVGLVIGYFWLDPWLDTFPLFTVVFIVLGVATGFYDLYRELVILERTSNEEQDVSDEKD
jgi:ATP synthase protein I